MRFVKERRRFAPPGMRAPGIPVTDTGYGNEILHLFPIDYLNVLGPQHSRVSSEADKGFSFYTGRVVQQLKLFRLTYLQLCSPKEAPTEPADADTGGSGRTL